MVYSNRALIMSIWYTLDGGLEKAKPDQRSWSKVLHLRLWPRFNISHLSLSFFPRCLIPLCPVNMTPGESNLKQSVMIRDRLVGCLESRAYHVTLQILFLLLLKPLEIFHDSHTRILGILLSSLQGLLELRQYQSTI